jgi:hypothetical protein
VLSVQCFEHAGIGSVDGRALVVAMDFVLHLVEVHSELVALIADEDHAVVAEASIAFQQLTHSALPQLVFHHPNPLHVSIRSTTVRLRMFGSPLSKNHVAGVGWFSQP